METKNIILSNYATALVNLAANFSGTVNTMGDNMEQNIATVKTLNILLESVRAQTTIIQNALDTYSE